MPTSQENLFHALFDNSPEAIVVADLDRRIKLVNTAFEEMFGYSSEDVLGQETSMFYENAEDFAEQGRAQFNPAATAKRSIRTITYRKKDGVCIEGQTVGSRIRNRQGEVVGFLALIRDVTDITRTQQALDEAQAEAKANEERFRTIYSQTPAMMHSVDLSGRIIEVSDHWLAVLGYRREEVIGRKSTDFLTEASREKAADVLAQFWRDGFCADVEYQMVNAAGDVLDVLLSGVVEYDREGREKQSFAVINDVTALRAAEHELKIEKDRAEAANVAKSQFLASMSHEIRTPLNGVLGMAQALARTELSGEQVRMVDLINESGQSLQGLLNDLLDLSKIEAGKLELDMLVFNPSELARTAIGLFDSLAGEKGLALRSRIHPRADCEVRSDPKRIKQIMHNLLSNAVKFTERGSVSLTIDVEEGASGDPGRLVCVVEDTGIGMSDGFVDQLFSRFTQADASITRKFGGTGLGLSICKELAEMLGGSIQVESEAGWGSSFRLDLPVEFAEPAAAKSVPSAPATPDTGEGAPFEGLRFLVVDDNPMNRQVAEALLAPFGPALTVAASAKEAIGLCAEQHYDLVLMDIQMPEMDGIAAMQAIREGWKAKGEAGVPILAMTANTMREQVEGYLAAGMDGHLGKPLEVRTMVQTIAAILAGEPEMRAAAS